MESKKAKGRKKNKASVACGTSTLIHVQIPDKEKKKKRIGEEKIFLKIIAKSL